MKEILQNWGALQFLVFVKTYSNAELKKTELFWICPDILRRVCYIMCLVLPLGLCALHVETKGELNEISIRKNNS